MQVTSWILADLAAAGTVRFARADAARTLIERDAALSTEAYPTFSDALLAYVRERGIDLRSTGCVLALPGPTAGDAIRVARSRWTLSRSGLGGMFGGPLLILNDMVATAWSLTEGGGALQPLSVAARPDLTRPGRWAVILLDDGVGASTLTITPDGTPVVADTEIGHIGFSPATADEFALMQTLRGYRAAVAWEQVLTRPGAMADPVQWAGIAGAFAGDVLLATAAWNGLILCGHRAATLRASEAFAAFAARGAAKASHGRFIEQAAVGLLPTRDPLAGCLAYLRTVPMARAEPTVMPLSVAGGRR